MEATCFKKEFFPISLFSVLGLLVILSDLFVNPVLIMKVLFTFT